MVHVSDVSQVCGSLSRSRAAVRLLCSRAAAAEAHHDAIRPAFPPLQSFSEEESMMRDAGETPFTRRR